MKTSPAPILELAESGDFEKDQSFSVGAWVKFPKEGATGAVVARMDDTKDHRGWDLWAEGNRVGTHIIHKWPENALKVMSANPVPADQWHHVMLSYDGTGKAAGVKIYVDGQMQAPRVDKDALSESIRTTVPLKVGQRHTQAKLPNSQIHDLRTFGRALPPTEVERLSNLSEAAYLAAKPADKRPATEVETLFGWYLRSFDAPYQELAKSLAAMESEQAAIKGRGTIAHVMQEKTQPPMAYLLFRGDYDKRRDQVNAGTPAVLPPMPADLPRNRLGLAQWLLRPENPLPTRVTVNRIWQELFGAGLVRTAGDFGVTGETPSHPELLDWLAVDFRETGWDLKKFYKMIVMSASYRQMATTTPEKLEKDPQNRLISRGPRFRMDAEMVRDGALAVSGLLVEKIGGPSVKPYQPDGVWEAVAMIGSNTRDYKRDSGEKLYRRSLYTFWKRSAPPASMEIFNAPPREVCSVRRERTNTPLQALVTLNDDQFVEAAKKLAELVLKQGGDTVEGRMDVLAKRLLARPFRPEESSVVRASIEDLLTHYKAHPDDAAKLLAVGESKVDPALDAPSLAAWTMLANELMNLDEVLNK